MGSYYPTIQEVQAKMEILYHTSRVIFAICDIKDPEKAKQAHLVLIEEIDINNMIKKMAEIYMNKIGGSDAMTYNYDFNMYCTHYQEQGSSCLEDEFC